MTSAAGEEAISANRDGSDLENGDFTPVPPSVATIEEENSETSEVLVKILSEERARQDVVGELNNSFSSNYGRIKDSQPQEEASKPHQPIPHLVLPESPSSTDGSLSVPDDTPSIQGSYRSGASGSPAPSGRPSRPYLSPSPRPSFERRFHARNNSSSSIPRASSPAFLTSQSRQSSHISQLSTQSIENEKGEDEQDEQQAWEVVRWTKLRKISGHAFSEVGKRTFGRPTYLAIAASIAIGTSKGLVLLFDYQQNLKIIIGQGTPAVESGSVTSLAISADHSTIASGHANGSIFTWEVSKSARPFLHIPSLDLAQVKTQKNDGHISGCAVLHVGFLGQRRTALVSADDSGMAFSHLATRGLGAVGRTVKTTRILGRYPETTKLSGLARKPSSVLAFSPLPLGNIERSTDGLGLTALLTPYLLVIVSTTPIAQTQLKIPRSKQVAAHSAMTGCLAWFPAVKLKANPSATEPTSSSTKLVYCWSNMLSVLEIDEDEGNTLAIEENRPPILNFRSRSHWQCDEAILAVQWLSRSIIAALSVTQRLIILEDDSMQVADSSDLNPKHIFHQDLFSRQLQPLVDKVEDEDNSMHGVIPDAYHMSFKAYKGRLFLLGLSEVSMGTLTNWADRLMTLMESGKFITAIELATSYYAGEIYGVTIGLPANDEARQAIVKDKLLELLSASLLYLSNDDEHDEDRDLRIDLHQFATAAFAACIGMNELGFLFDQMYDVYSDASMPDIFLYALEPYIIDGKIDIVPSAIFKDLTNWYASLDLGVRLEQIICSLQPFTMDIDQVTTICKQQKLFDALIYVWTQGLRDYVTPLIELIAIANNYNQAVLQGNQMDAQDDLEHAMKIFPYMAFTLTGRQYPSELELSQPIAIRAKASMYGFLFSGRAVQWPKSRGRLILTQPRGSPEPVFPYLHVILHFDASNFLSMLNEAFEDPYLNGGQDQLTNGITASEVREESLGMSVNRQRIVNILLEVMSSPEFNAEDKIYLDIFIARNLPKFAQFILLPGSTLRQTLVELCNFPQPDLASECQLSVEYLLSIYHPPDMQEIINLLHYAGFNRVLKSIYRADKQYPKWLEAFFEDEDDRDAIFSCIGDCLRPSAGLTRRQVGEVKEVLIRHGKELAAIDTCQTATVLETFAPDLLEEVFNRLAEGSATQFRFLRAIMEPTGQHRENQHSDIKFVETHRERYIELMCQQDPTHVVDYITLLDSGDLHLDRVLSAMESSGVIDAAVTLLARDGLVRDAMDRLVKHMMTLKTALTGLLDAASETPDISSAQEAISDLLQDISKYIKLGIWLCQGQTKPIQPSKSNPSQRNTKSDEMTEANLTTEEILWLDLIDAIVTTSRAVNAAVSSSATYNHAFMDNVASKASETLRTIVQSVFTALLASTSSSITISSPSIPRLGHEPISSPKSNDHRFLHILRAFLTRTSRASPTLSDLRKVLSSIFSAYAFEESMMTLANAFLDKDVFVHMEDAQRLRGRGWKPRGQMCEGCKRRAWGPGAGEGIWSEWRERREHDQTRRKEKWIRAGAGVDGGELGTGFKGKGLAVGSNSSTHLAKHAKPQLHATNHEEGHDVPLPTPAAVPDRIVVFSCGHTFHQKCLELVMQDAGITTKGSINGGTGGRNDVFKCPICIE